MSKSVLFFFDPVMAKKDLLSSIFIFFILAYHVALMESCGSDCAYKLANVRNGIIG
jgi:hypothetical protein